MYNNPMSQGMGSQMSNPNAMMDTMKSNIMTMMMFQNMGGGSNNGNKKQDMFSMVYVFLITSLVDYVFKYIPVVVNYFQKRYMDKINVIKRELDSKTVDITDNKVKKKSSSITITINVNSQDNIFGHAILDYITNNKNTTHVSFIRNNFILNQKDVINIDEDIFAKMSISTTTDSSSTPNGSQTSSSNDSNGITQIIEIYSFKFTNDQLREYLDNIKQKYMLNVKNKLGNKRYFFNMHPINAMIDIDKRKDYSRLPPNILFTMKQFQTNRKFSNLFGNDIDIIRNRVGFFTKYKSWYDEKGIPYTLGLLLSGNPGTGKTSTIKCLANETNRHICNINLNNDISKRQLENLFFNEDIYVTNPNTNQTETYSIPLNQRIYVFEDVDCQADIVRERASNKNDTNDDSKSIAQDSNKIDLSFLLNLLDGVLENPGRIIIMTSNHPDILDSALIRPGRIDVIAKFSNCTNQTVIKMMEFFYDIKLSTQYLDIINLLIPEIVTPAELSKIMFENFGNYEKAIEKLQEISIEKKISIEKANLIKQQEDKIDLSNKDIVDDISDETTEETNIESDTGIKEIESVDDFIKKMNDKKPSLESQPIVSDFPLIFIKNKFTEDVKINGDIVSKKIMNNKMEEYAKLILKMNISKHDKLWNAITDYLADDLKVKLLREKDINKYKDLKKNFIDMYQDVIFETPFFKEFTKEFYKEQITGRDNIKKLDTHYGVITPEHFIKYLDKYIPYKFNDEITTIFKKNKIDLTQETQSINSITKSIDRALNIFNILGNLTSNLGTIQDYLPNSMLNNNSSIGYSTY